MSEENNDIDELMMELKTTKDLGSFLDPTKSIKPTEVPDVDEDNINEFIMKTTAKLIQP